MMKEVFPSGQILAIRYFSETQTGLELPVQKTTRYVNSSRVSVNTPNFAILKKQDQLPINGYAFAEHHVVHLGASHTERRQSSAPSDLPIRQDGPLALHVFGNISDPTWAGKFPLTSIADSGFDGELSNRFLRKMREGQFDASVALGEVRETARFLSHRGGLVARVLLEMASRGRFGSKGPHGRESIHNLWLEYRYGLMPLVNDIQSAIDILDQKPLADLRTITVSASKRYDDRGRYSVNFGAFDCDMWLDVESHGTRSGVLHIEVSLENPLYARLSSLGLLNPVATLHELTPYSFVLDWFLPLGDYLSNFTATAGYAFRRGWQTVKAKMDHHATLRARFGRTNTSLPPYWVGGVSESVLASQFRFQRTPLTSFPTPALPSFRFRGLFSEFASGAALVRQRFTR